MNIILTRIKPTFGRQNVILSWVKVKLQTE
jgi:hypothetical protein